MNYSWHRRLIIVRGILVGMFLTTTFMHVFADVPVTSADDPCTDPAYCPPTINADLPLNVEEQREFKVDIWLQTKEEKNSSIDDPIPVYMEQTTSVSYEPRVLHIRPNERSTVTAKVLRSSSGLAEIRAMAEGYRPLLVSINTGFRGRLIDTFPKELEAGTIRSFVVKLIDEKGNPLSLETSGLFSIEATAAELRSGNNNWSPALKFNLDPGESSTPVLQARATSWTHEDGSIRARLLINPQRKAPTTVATKVSEFNVVPSWWLALLTAAVGGTLSSLYTLSRSRPAARGGRSATAKVIGTLFGGFSAGCLAYFLATWNILGIRVDTTSLRGFVVLGFLFAYVGIEPVVKRALGQDPPKTV